MAESEGIHTIDNQAAIQAVIPVMMVLVYTNVVSQQGAKASLGATETQTWWTNFIEVLIQLEFPGQVY